MVCRLSILRNLAISLSLTSVVCADQWTAVGNHSFKLQKPGTGISTSEKLQAVYPTGDGHYFCLFTDGSIINAGDIDNNLNPPPTPNTPVRHIAARPDHIIILTQTNQLLQQGTSQTLITFPSNLPDLTSVHFADDDIIAIKTDGNLIEWTSTGTIKTTTPSFQSPAKKIVHAQDKAYVILEDNSLHSWDTNSGQIQTLSLNATSFVDIATDGTNVLLVDSTGELETIGTIENIPQDLKKATSVAMQANFIAVIHPDNTATSWGNKPTLASRLNALENVKSIQLNSLTAHVVFTDGSRKTITNSSSSIVLAPVVAGATQLGSLGEYLTYSRELKNPISNQYQPEFGIPNQITNPRSISGGRNNFVVVYQDGSVGSFGTTSEGPCVTPPEAINLTKVVAKWDNVIGLTDQGNTVLWTKNRFVNRLPNNLPKAKDIAVGGYVGYIISETDQVVPIGNFTAPAPSSIGAVKAIACGWDSAAVIKADGSLANWNESGSIAHQEVDIIHDDECTLIAATTYRGYAVTRSGKLITWPQGSFNSSNTLTATEVVGAENLVEIRGSLSGMFGRRADGSVIEVIGTTFVQHPELSNIAHITGQSRNFVAFESNGKMRTSNDSFRPLLTPPTGSTIRTLFENQMGQDNSGNLLIWGREADVTLEIPADSSTYTKVVRNSDAAIALKTDGTLVAIGNQYSSIYSIPQNLNNVTDIDCSESHAIALHTDGSLTAWGNDPYNELAIPLNIPNIVAISCGGNHTLALTNQGQVIAWGRDDYGQSSVPATLSNVVRIEAGPVHSVALKDDGSVVTWGFNFSGQLQIPTWTGPITDIAASSDENATYYRFGPSGQATYDQLTTDITLAGLTAQDADPTAISKPDGIPNLIKWASNLNLHQSNNQSLNQQSATAGLPEFKTINTPDGPAFQLQYLRRKNTSLIYIPKFSTDLALFSEMQGAETITPINVDWEKVTITKPLSPSSVNTGFGKVEVSIP